jgi:hypothetical protein
MSYNIFFIVYQVGSTLDTPLSPAALTRALLLSLSRANSSSDRAAHAVAGRALFLYIWRTKSS